MSSTESSSDLVQLQQQLESLSKDFDFAIKKDVPLGELKIIFHEMKIVKERLNEITKNGKNV